MMRAGYLWDQREARTKQCGPGKVQGELVAEW